MPHRARERKAHDLFKRYEGNPILKPEDKDACLFPRRFDGRFALIHRPIARGEAHIWLSLSPDLKHWGDHQLLIHTRHAH